jgi:ABC-type phosphate transport system substrate-binding protein
MNHGLVRIRLSLAAALALATAFHCLPAQAGDDVRASLIANPAVVNASLTDQEVQNIYLGKKTQWDDGKSITVVTTGNDLLHEAFLKRFIKKTPSQFRIFWKKMEFTGTGTTPNEIATEDAVIEFVKKTEGAMGYVSSEKAAASGCKVLTQQAE